LLPDGPPDTEIVHHAARLGVAARALSEYCAAEAGQPRRNGLVLGYGLAEAERIPELVARLVAAKSVLDAVHNISPE
jgi:DNA-binding transcriptional MocR family regulator